MARLRLAWGGRRLQGPLLPDLHDLGASAFPVVQAAAQDQLKTETNRKRLAFLHLNAIVLCPYEAGQQEVDQGGIP